MCMAGALPMLRGRQWRARGARRRHKVAGTRAGARCDRPLEAAPPRGAGPHCQRTGLRTAPLTILHARLTSPRECIRSGPHPRRAPAPRRAGPAGGGRRQGRAAAACAPRPPGTMAASGEFAFAPAVRIAGRIPPTLQLVDVLVANVEPQHAAPLVKALAKDLPLGPLHHLKRVRRRDGCGGAKPMMQLILHTPEHIMSGAAGPGVGGSSGGGGGQQAGAQAGGNGTVAARVWLLDSMDRTCPPLNFGWRVRCCAGQGCSWLRVGAGGSRRYCLLRGRMGRAEARAMLQQHSMLLLPPCPLCSPSPVAPSGDAWRATR